MAQWPNRRQYLATLGTLGVAGVAGCSQGDSSTEPAETEAQTSTPDGETVTFEEDFDYTAAQLEDNGWTVDGLFSIEASRLTADFRSNAYAATTLPEGFTGSWELNDVQNNTEGRGLQIRFAVDLPEDDLEADVDQYRLQIRQLPDGIGNDYEGNNVAMWRIEDGEWTTMFEPSYDHEGAVHDYRIENDQGQFQLFIDGKNIGEFDDETSLYEDVTHINIRMDGERQYVDEIRQES